MCATGSEALRNACYAVASGAYDVAMAIGVEKLKDSGYLRARPAPPSRARATTAAGEITAPANFSPPRPRLRRRSTASTEDELKDVITRIAWKNHVNGARNPRAQFRKEVPMERDPAAPIVAGHARRVRLLGRLRRLGGGDRRAGRGRPQVHRQADLREGAVLRRRPGRRAARPGLRLHHLPRGRRAPRRTPTGRRASPTRAPSSPWPRSTTASRRPSWC